MESAQAPLHRLRPHEGLQHHPEGLRPDHGAEERQQVSNINREGEKLLQSTRQSALSSSSQLKFENVLQDGGDPDEAFLPREPCGEDRLPEGRRGRHQEAPLVPGFNIF